MCLCSGVLVLESSNAQPGAPVSSVMAESGTRKIGKIMRSPMLSTPKP